MAQQSSTKNHQGHASSLASAVATVFSTGQQRTTATQNTTVDDGDIVIVSRSSSSSSEGSSSFEEVEPVTNYEVLDEENPIQSLDIEDGNTTTDDTESSQTSEGQKSKDSLAAKLSKCWWKFKSDDPLGDRSRNYRAEIPDNTFNAVAHVSALILLGFGSTILIIESSIQGAAWKVASLSIYCATLCFAFGPTSLFYTCPIPIRFKGVFQFCDYIAFYIMIAGTFTPVCLAFLHDSVIGWIFFGISWTIAFLNLYATATQFDKVPKWFTCGLCISLAFMGIFFSFWLQDAVGWGLVCYWLLGGILYTIGGIIYVTEKPNFLPGTFGFYELSNLFVIFGAAVHWILMYIYVLPWQRPEE